MYCSFFPLLVQLKKELGIAMEHLPLDVPESFYGRIDTKDPSGTFVVVEELKSQGYVMIDKRTGSDFNHAKLALTSLANYHALTMAFLRKYRGPDGQIKYPTGVEFLNEASAPESIPTEITYGWLKSHIELMKLLGRQDVRHFRLSSSF